jgi:hypothetical protein
MNIPMSETGLGAWHTNKPGGRVFITCPKCGSLFIDLAAPKSIREDGSIPHLMMCPNDMCSFEDESMILLNWGERRQKPR